MLKGIDPILSPDLLHTLRAMGHGDEIAIVDANFPAAATAHTLHRLDGSDAITIADAILNLFPLDTGGDGSAWCMAAADNHQSQPPIHAEFRDLLVKHGAAEQLVGLDRQAFYARAKSAFAVIATGERRLYGNILFRKGVIA